MNIINFQNAIVAALDQAPGRFGEYEVKFGRVWRGGRVIAYVDNGLIVPSEFGAPNEVSTIQVANKEAQKKANSPNKSDFISPGDETPTDTLPDDKRVKDAPSAGGEEPPVDLVKPKGGEPVIQPGEDEEELGPGEKPKSATKKPAKLPPVQLQPGSKERMPDIPVLTIREGLGESSDNTLIREIPVDLLFHLRKKDDMEHMETVNGKDYFYEAVEFSLVLVSRDGDRLEEREIFDYRVWHGAQPPVQEVVEKRLKNEIESVCLYARVSPSDLEKLARELYVKMDAVRRFVSKEPKYEGEESKRGHHLAGKLREAAMLAS